MIVKKIKFADILITILMNLVTYFIVSMQRLKSKKSDSNNRQSIKD